jgi:hypothetical protein
MDAAERRRRMDALGSRDVERAPPRGPAIDPAFSELGFRQRGRFWVLGDSHFQLSPAPGPAPGDRHRARGGATGGGCMITYDEFQADVRRRRRERWLTILAGEAPERGPGRRPRDPEQERLLLALDRARLARRGAELVTRREPPR